MGQVSARYMDHDMRLEQTFTNGPVDAAGNTGLMFNGQGNQQKNMAFDANYSQMFDLLGHKSEFVLGPTTSATSRTSRPTPTATSARSMCSISTRPGSPSRTTATPRMTMRSSRSSVCMAKVTWRLMEPLAVITGARVSWYDLDAVSTTLSSGAQSGESSAFNGKLTPYAGPSMT